MFHKLRLMLVAAALMAAPIAAHAQEERLKVYGSLNVGYAMSDSIPVAGAPRDGTTDFRVWALQFRYRTTDKDQFVLQLVQRKAGTSPLNAAFPSIYPGWLYYEHKFENGFRMKAGRNPLPRGIYNEVRYIGTLLPFYRVGSTVYGETLEFLDGVTVNKSYSVGGLGIDATLFGGGFDITAGLPNSKGGIDVIQARLEQTVGTQLWLTTPVPGVRLGAFAARFREASADAYPMSSFLWSIDGDWSRAFAKAEWSQFLSNASRPESRTEYRGFYAVAGVKPFEGWTVAGTYEAASRWFSFPEPVTPSSMMQNIQEEWAGSIVRNITANLSVKLELHHRSGYNFDSAVPSLIPPQGPPFAMGLAPRSNARFGILSIAATF